ncbi:XRE family transcriptional regulator [Staphylococcus agnetis]|uniref:spr1629 family repressor/antitoxin n=1 Tax=Staphylococcus agnetis TaxID=985762 RepID=UPI00208FCE9B|nr:XRE family transcriptional regulator [Staphylococcus agnetis]MCO4338920.1 XRE family transcriptional regulator [Staphylococcus agnetis]MCO4342249.1 XRE family transcriptional regulator [Staphylococcus agnetis]MCO4344622.1 XRE family transcriptional regulator [Staphylococcus agnetis]MCO4346950.1 XRE family transcriptional regulator [Staphylococcus agnetis]MCO4349389.1 XRE family transcriptional regulator [Staphylococcus agnetis]
MFYGKNLTYIRQLNGMSRNELAIQLNVSEQAIWQYETKNAMPDISKIYSLANTFHVKTNFFMKEQHSYFSNESVDRHRIAFRSKNQNTSIKILNKQHYQATFMTNLTEFLFSNISQPTLAIYDILNQVEALMSHEKLTKGKINEIACIARKYIIDSSNNANLLLQIEKTGIIVFEQQLDQYTDTFSYWSDSNLPFIVLGDNKGIAVRRNFDIAHELGHLLLHRKIEFDLLSKEEFKDIEKEADCFAAYFLLPEEAFMEDFNNLNKKSNPEHYMLLKEKWHVSIQAMAMRAYYLGGLTESQYRYFWALINKKGYKQLEPLDKDIKLPRPIKINSLLNLLFEKGVLQPTELLEMFRVNPEFFQNLLRINSNVFYKFMTINHQSQKDQILNSIVTIDRNK